MIFHDLNYNSLTNFNFKSAGGFALISADIALLEIEPPFKFSASLTPACLDDSGYNEQSLQPGGYGSIADVGTI